MRIDVNAYSRILNNLLQNRTERAIGRSELLVKWVLPKTSGRKAGVQVVLIK